MSARLPVTLPQALEIVPLQCRPDVTMRVPGSKSMTNRALVLAALSSASSGCTIEGALRSEDTELMIEALGRLGFNVRPQWNLAPPVVDVKYPSRANESEAGRRP